MELALGLQLLLVLLLVGALPAGPQSADWRYYPSRLVGILVGVSVLFRVMNGF